MDKTDTDTAGPYRKRCLSGNSSTLSSTGYIQREHISRPGTTPAPPADTL